MPTPTGFDSARTGTPDPATGILMPTVVMQEAALEAPLGIAISDRIASGVTADRIGSGLDLSTDMSTAGFAGAAGANLFNINNRGALAIWVQFVTVTDTMSLTVVFYDAANNPLFLSPTVAFSAQAQRITATGLYMSIVAMVDTYGASKYRAFVLSKGNTTDSASIFCHPV